MKKIIFSIGFLISLNATAQNVGINATGAVPVTSAALDVDMANKGVLIPRVALTTRTLFAPVTGVATTSLLVYNTATAGTFPNNVTPGYYYWNGTAWVRLINSGTAWELLGNAGTVQGTNFMGTTDNVGMDFRTNNTLRERFFNTGEVVVNSTTAFAGDMFSAYATTTQTAVSGYATGSGFAGYFSHSGTNSSILGLYTGTTANISVGFFASTGAGAIRGIEISDAAGNTGLGLASFHSGTATGRAGNFQNNSATNTDVALFASHAGNGRVINAQNSLTTTTQQVGFFSQLSTGTTAAFNNAAAVWGQSNGIRTGVFIGSGASTNNTVLQGANGVLGNFDIVGVLGQSQPAAGFGYGVLGIGNFYGVFSVGNFGATGTKAFAIDHPLDPENKVLKHYSMESPEVLNMYRGNVVTDASGNATITLPSYFSSININVSYVLTPIGGQANVYVATEVNSQGVFTIAGANPGQKISWCIYAERNDPYMQAHPDAKLVEVNKKPEDQGKYLSPEAYGQPQSSGQFERNKANPSLVQPAQPALPRTGTVLKTSETLEF